MVRLQQYRNQYMITLPKDKVEQAGWRKGDDVTLDYDRRTGELILSKLKK